MGPDGTGETRAPGEFVGPTKIDCDLKCDIPAGVVVSEIPRPRHAWSDVIACPNEPCERAFLIVKRPGQEESTEEEGQDDG